MVTGWTKVELDALFATMEEVVPPVPSKYDKRDAARVVAMKIAGADKGAVFNLETKDGIHEMYWFHCWVAKELAGAMSFASETHGWAQKRLAPAPSDHIVAPEPSDIASATEVLSLATLAEPGGILVRLAVGNPIKHRLLFFPVRAALEAMLAIAEGGTAAGWWNEDFELIPSRESQH